jgi:hypothetical protein
MCKFARGVGPAHPSPLSSQLSGGRSCRFSQLASSVILLADRLQSLDSKNGEAVVNCSPFTERRDHHTLPHDPRFALYRSKCISSTASGCAGSCHEQLLRSSSTALSGRVV